MNAFVSRPLVPAGPALACLAAALALLPAAAQNSNRGGRAEGLVFFQYMAGDKAKMEMENGMEVEADFDSFYGGGIGFGYNLDEHWNLNGAFSIGAVDMTPKLSPYDSDVAAFNFSLNADYNIFPTRFTPFVTAGLGFSYFYEFEEYNCYCGGPAYSTVVVQDQTTFTTGVGAGLRWDISDNVFCKLFYRANVHFGLDDIEDEMLFHEVHAVLGFMF